MDLKNSDKDFLSSRIILEQEPLIDNPAKGASNFGKLYERDGNIYNIAYMGIPYWMRRKLKTISCKDLTSLSNITDNVLNNNENINKYMYGGLCHNFTIIDKS